ncbi:hypothetical protein DPMN_172557 [Dreissena polymorpha]|uniref:Uncharacterized protein n=1 Tax=Dreissena polymorpha TaxID=45954 RepID=A0A9D4IDF5_DREPO|nr:hypothetical protein DPMN_172557 [Dreissena polymorpha]
MSMDIGNIFEVVRKHSNARTYAGIKVLHADAGLHADDGSMMMMLMMMMDACCCMLLMMMEDDAETDWLDDETDDDRC